VCAWCATRACASCAHAHPHTSPTAHTWAHAPLLRLFQVWTSIFRTYLRAHTYIRARIFHCRASWDRHPFPLQGHRPVKWKPPPPFHCLGGGEAPGAHAQQHAGKGPGKQRGGSLPALASTLAAHWQGGRQAAHRALSSLPALASTPAAHWQGGRQAAHRALSSLPALASTPAAHWQGGGQAAHRALSSLPALASRQRHVAGRHRKQSTRAYLDVQQAGVGDVEVHVAHKHHDRHLRAGGQRGAHARQAVCGLRSLARAQHLRVRLTQAPSLRSRKVQGL